MLDLLEINISKLLAKSTKEKKKGGHLLENCSIRSIWQLGRMEGFPFQRNVCNQIIGINLDNLD
jgi:hypothetical protein